MKLIIAYIQPEKLNDVKQSLFNANIKHLSATNSVGCGRQGGYSESYRGNIVEVNLLPKVRLEIGVNDDFVDKAIKAIVEGAKTDTEGDGKIFIQNLEDAVRIRTGERGKDAIG